MKDNLNLKKYKTENVKGTFNLLEEKTFFGTKVMDIEDEIDITNQSIQYLQMFASGTSSETENNGFQNYEIDSIIEKLFITDIFEVKADNHSIKKLLQKKLDEKYNTNWEIEIDIKEILKIYLFSKIKEARTFRSLRFDDFENNDINDSIYEYIVKNILDRYEFSSIELYVKYVEINKNAVYDYIASKQYSPIFNLDVEEENYRVTNANMKLNLFLDKLAPIIINYFQTKSSLEYKFDYYFNIHYKKI